jgi:hypothetical protein
LWISSRQAQTHQKQISDETFIVFFILEVLSFRLYREVKPFLIWFYPSWQDYDISLHKFVGLVVVIPMIIENGVRMLKLWLSLF